MTLIGRRAALAIALAPVAGAAAEPDAPEPSDYRTDDIAPRHPAA